MGAHEAVFPRWKAKMKWTVRHFLKNTLQRAGYEVRRLESLTPQVSNTSYATVSPYATYSPWLTDANFKETYEAIRYNTLVDYYRCYELWQLVGEAAKLIDGDVIEIGTWRGGSGCLIARKCHLEGMRARVYLCDTFKGVVKAGPLDTDYRGREHSDTSKKIVEDLLGKLKLNNSQVLEGIFPEETGHFLADKKFRFCHIDVDVYQSAKDIVEWIWGRMVPGGLIVYDDYGFFGCSGITQFVNEERNKPGRMIIHNLNGHAVIVKIG